MRNRQPSTILLLIDIILVDFHLEPRTNNFRFLISSPCGTASVMHAEKSFGRVCKLQSQKLLIEQSK